MGATPSSGSLREDVNSEKPYTASWPGLKQFNRQFRSVERTSRNTLYYIHLRPFSLQFLRDSKYPRLHATARARSQKMHGIRSSCFSPTSLPTHLGGTLVQASSNSERVAVFSSPSRTLASLIASSQCPFRT